MARTHRQGTYTEVADAIMGKGFSRFTVRPAQYINFFPTAAIMILVGGTALATIDSLDGKQTLSLRLWMVIVSNQYCTTYSSGGSISMVVYQTLMVWCGVV